MLQQENRQENKQPADKVMANKRRAIFGDITNDSVSTLIAGKKLCNEQSKTVAKVKDVVQLQCISEVNGKQGSTLDTKDANDALLPSTEDDMPSSMDIDLVELTAYDQKSVQDTDWVDVDKDNLHLPSHVAIYVNDIFDYYRQRELRLVVSDYMQRQSDLTTSMRAILVDWLVEVQQNFELNHETLYTAVKLTDRYIDGQQDSVSKDRLQLIGASALNIACKFEERSPPVIDDFLYICDDAYTRDELLAMEISILKTVNFDVGIPLSYTYVRRFAQCARVAIPTLTLSRYILESALMDYSLVSCHESKLAAAALLLAMNMNVEGQWDFTMKHYTSYEVNDLTELACHLNNMIARPQPKSGLNAVVNKYSHPVFHKVAKIPVLNAVEMELLCSSGSSQRKSGILS